MTLFRCWVCRTLCRVLPSSSLPPPPPAAVPGLQSPGASPPAFPSRSPLARSPVLPCPVLSSPVLSCPLLSFPVPVVRFRLAYLSAVPKESDGDGSFSRTAERFLSTRERDTDRLWDRERENLCACGRGGWGVYVIVKIRGEFTETRL